MMNRIYMGMANGQREMVVASSKEVANRRLKLKEQGWFLNGQMPTDMHKKEEYNGVVREVTVRKYTFWKKLNEDSVIVYDTSEFGAWEQLMKIKE